MNVARAGDLVTVRAPGFGFIKAEALARLKDGRSVRVDLELEVLPGPGGPAAAQGRQTCVLSYDLWEERFAVTLAGSRPRLGRVPDADCRGSLVPRAIDLPVGALGRLASEPFWVRPLPRAGAGRPFRRQWRRVHAARAGGRVEPSSPERAADRRRRGDPSAVAAMIVFGA